jgi:hypothetical protein
MKSFPSWKRFGIVVVVSLLALVSALPTAHAQIDPEIKPAVDEVFGFEAPLASTWKISSGEPSLSAVHTEGRTALALQSLHGNTILTSTDVSVLNTEFAPTIAVDLALPSPQTSSASAGALQMFLSCPSQGIQNTYLGEQALKGRDARPFASYAFGLPAQELRQLQKAGCSDLSVRLALNVPTGTAGAYLIDNIRFAALTSSVTSVDLGRTVVGSVVKQNILLTNRGRQEIDVLSTLVVSQDSPRMFKVDVDIVPCVRPGESKVSTMSFRPGESRVLTVSFTAQVEGSFDAVLEIQTQSEDPDTKIESPNAPIRLPFVAVAARTAETSK